MRHATLSAVILAAICTFVSSVPTPGEHKVPESPEAAYLGLPSGSDGIVSPIDITFSCAQRALGYYADVSNNCKIFHVCNPILMSDGQVAMMQYSFVCPNNTQFDQQTLTCTLPPGTAPCHQAENFYYLNRHVGQGGAEGVPENSPPVLPPPVQHQDFPRPAVVPEPKHEAPLPQLHKPSHEAPQQQKPSHAQPQPAGPSPVAEEDVARPSSYYG